LSASQEALVQQRLKALLACPLEALLGLPECVEEELMLDGQKVKLTTFHETLEGSKHRLIVQAVRRRWGGITAKVIAGGYELSETALPRELLASELYDFT
jgi:hypothetical protein